MSCYINWTRQSVEKGAFTVFNELEEKIADYEGNNIKIDTTNELVDIIKELDDLGIGIWKVIICF